MTGQLQTHLPNLLLSPPLRCLDLLQLYPQLPVLFPHLPSLLVFPGLLLLHAEFSQSYALPEKFLVVLLEFTVGNDELLLPFTHLIRQWGQLTFVLQFLENVDVGGVLFRVPGGGWPRLMHRILGEESRALLIMGFVRDIVEVLQLLEELLRWFWGRTSVGGGREAEIRHSIIL